MPTPDEIDEFNALPGHSDDDHLDCWIWGPGYVGRQLYGGPTYRIDNMTHPPASMRIYLDMCCLQRPMDDQTHLRIHVEAEAILGVLAWCETGEAELLNSVALNYEVDHNPHPARKAFVQETLLKCQQTIQASDSVERRARIYCDNGLKVLDALHLACAVAAKATYFCTCDDRFYRRAKQLDTSQTLIVSPLELIEVIEP